MWVALHSEDCPLRRCCGPELAKWPMLRPNWMSHSEIWSHSLGETELARSTLNECVCDCNDCGVWASPHPHFRTSWITAFQFQAISVAFSFSFSWEGIVSSVTDPSDHLYSRRWIKLFFWLWLGSAWSECVLGKGTTRMKDTWSSSERYGYAMNGQEKIEMRLCTVRREKTRSHSDLDMWNRLAPYVLK